MAKKIKSFSTFFAYMVISVTLYCTSEAAKANTSAQPIIDATTQTKNANPAQNPRINAASKSDNEYIRLLINHQYPVLDAKFNAMQQDFEAGKIDDFKLEVAFNGFRIADPALEAPLDAWLQAFPRSYAAHVARGVYYLEIGQNARGDGYANKTSPKQFNALNTAIAKARTDLNTSLILNNKLLISYAYLLKIAKYYSDDSDLPMSRITSFILSNAHWKSRPSPNLQKQQDLLNAANHIAPHNFIARHSYMYNLQTKWGGSTQAMRNFFNKSKTAGLTPAELGYLESQVLLDHAWVEDQRGLAEASAVDYAAAIDQFGADINQFYPEVYVQMLDETAFELQKIKKYDSAFKYFQRAIEVDSKDVYAWSSLGFYFRQRHDLQSAANADRIAAELGNATAQDA